MTQPDFTIAEFAAWARTKPADEKYNFCDARNCAVAQFGAATGRKPLIGIGDAETAFPEVYAAVNSEFEGWTFGALAARLEALLAEPKTDWGKPETYLMADCGECVA